nr:uncharacterized protein LOC127304738 [Lolium perenne]
MASIIWYRATSTRADARSILHPARLRHPFPSNPAQRLFPRVHQPPRRISSSHRESHHAAATATANPTTGDPHRRPHTSWIHAVAGRPRRSCFSSPQGRDPPARRAAAGRLKLLLSALPLGGSEAHVLRAAKVLTLLLAAPPPAGRKVLLAASRPGGREASARRAAKVATLMLAGWQRPCSSPHRRREAGPAVLHVAVGRPSTSCLMLRCWLGTPDPLVLLAVTGMAKDGWCFSPPLSSLCSLCFLSK